MSENITVEQKVDVGDVRGHAAEAIPLAKENYLQVVGESKPYVPTLKIISRNPNGLINDKEYVFDNDGFVDWRAMIPKEYLVPNKDKTKETDISKLEDKDLLILLGGIKYLANLRGYKSIKFSHVIPFSDQCTACCEITFIPNFETEGREVVFSDIGDATLSNTKSFGQFYLGPIAANRAFVRCIRNFLRIAIVGADEIGLSGLNAEQNINHITPVDVLKSLLKSKNSDFEALKTRMIKDKYEGAEKYEKVEDIPAPIVFELIKRIKKGKN